MTRSERWERATDAPLLWLGFAFLFAYATPIIAPEIGSWWRLLLEWVEIATWAAFALDFTVRLSLARGRLKFIRTHLLDLVAVALPLFRPLRALRVLSIVILSARRLSKKLKNRVMTYAAVTAVSVWFIAGLAVTDAERGAPGANIHSVWEGWWWSFITMATVGFGDLYPVTAEGRLVTVGLVATGIALIGTLTAFIAAWFASASREAEEEIKAELDVSEDKLDALKLEIGELKTLVERLLERPVPPSSPSPSPEG
ncbi:two pore domain potassium channel family protein [Cryobacterium sp. TMT1-21]|uniref:Two pore domain potassium channel family protein n=2 Tax=Cryobacterium shii TaxID=1259235 RepID=A0AAQ2C923_9MICO|nr:MULTISPECIES: potassium channel family protein [unclassified Cryobacterium]TFC52903.1 two pore domain potassium channel family protein [Cryobacterium shii]TFC81083.1 two pore domain potassium channel family protein [Cryobacterium sp. TmT2-59]TFD09048.1 two pore domain potassium channel family protein [Cryobacterium sp. TMT1-21]TFD18849.1 two pore domain potassium channel family protein [Cryobacterium sp. TMT4-10]TFD21946.1 two pore domain potassium channel family protein [Cryobacterium sp. 